MVWVLSTKPGTLSLILVDCEPSPVLEGELACRPPPEMGP